MQEHLSKQDILTLEKNIGYTFENKKLLINALIHRSYLNEYNLKDFDSYEKLEFLGDAVLELVIREELFKKNPDKDEGTLSKIKSTMVNKTNLSEIANKLNLGNFILLGKGEMNTEGYKKESILADVLESILAAIYIDSSFIRVQKVIKKIFNIKNVLSVKKILNDYKTLLQETTQNIYKIVPEYSVLEEVGPSHNKTFKVAIKVNKIVTYGKGKSKKIAEQSAAKKALKLIQNDK